jgi:ketosteroid isomerase-like protein
MDRVDVDRWLDAYVTAWKSNDRDLIGVLFAEDVSYRYHPFDAPVTGRAAVVGAWLGEEEHPGASTVDTPGTFDAVYRTVAVDGDTAVATGSSTYLTEPGGTVDQVYDNCFVMRFDQAGQCREFTEWYIRRPRPGQSTTAPEDG